MKSFLERVDIVKKAFLDSGCGCGCDRGANFVCGPCSLVGILDESKELVADLQSRSKELEDGIRKHQESRALNGYANPKDVELWKLVAPMSEGV